MDEEEIFMQAGVIKASNEFLGAIGVYDYFWALAPDVRAKIIVSWKKSLDFLAEVQEEMDDMYDPDGDFGTMALFSDEEPVEVIQYTNNVVPFKR